MQCLSQSLNLYNRVSIFFYFYWLSFYRSAKFDNRKIRVTCCVKGRHKKNFKIKEFPDRVFSISISKCCHQISWKTVKSRFCLPSGLKPPIFFLFGPGFVLLFIQGLFSVLELFMRTKWIGFERWPQCKQKSWNGVCAAKSRWGVIDLWGLWYLGGLLTFFNKSLFVDNSRAFFYFTSGIFRKWYLKWRTLIFLKKKNRLM